MSDKTSQRTEEEMLDQTFVGYNEEMTVETQDSTKGEGQVAGSGKDTKGGKNKNILIYGAMGVAALGIVGYKLMPSLTAPPPPPMPTQPQVTQEVAAVTTEPIQLSENAQQNNSAVNLVERDDPVAQFTENSTTTTTVVTEPVVTEPVVAAPVVAEPVVAEPVVAAPVVAAPVTTATTTQVTTEKVSIVDNSAAASSNERLLSQFQDMLDRKYDPKFDKIEKSLNEQKDFNKSIAERLARLEEGKSTKVVATKTSSSTTTDFAKSENNYSGEKKAVKRIVRRPVVIKKKIESNVTTVNKITNIEGDEVLIDRVTTTTTKVKPVIQKIEPVYPKIEIHSVYSGRIWTKNMDGTLSTFAVGDKLPTGEIIKKIDEDKEKITTDKRVISQ